MEIRQDDKYWSDKYEDLLSIACAFRDERNQLRSQLSEALAKIREYREAETAAKTITDAVRKYERAVADAFANPHSELSRALAKAFRKPFKSEPAVNTTEIKGKSPTHAVVDELAYPIPHHGPGLSEAEDAMRGTTGQPDEQDGKSPTRRDTYVPGKGGIVGTGARSTGMVEKDEPIFPERKCGNCGRPLALFAQCAVCGWMKETENDPINPSHYKRGGLEAIDVIRAATEGLQGEEAYCTGNAIKYLFRWKEKGGRQDLEKARWYVNRLLGDV